MDKKKTPFRNRLSAETSPYLLQHADNPVDWHPWGEEAFKKAEEEDKPIFLSIGYSTCHWCHVMARESFEDEGTAKLLNRTFIPVKVDREERPDIDAVYMRAAVLATGRGGWPLTILMTPEKVPFFAGTYIPRTSRYGMMGLADIIETVHAMWSSDRKSLLDPSWDLMDAIQSRDEDRYASGPNPAQIEKAARSLKRSFDRQNGGFGGSPKFPSPHQLIFLLRYGQTRNDEEAVEMALVSLKKMRRGGIYDHVGGGFHRYSTDERWLVPHFEKMLYDQAMHIMACMEAYQVTKDPAFRETLEGTADYVMEVMRDRGGAFHSAEDADSEGEEGVFHTWTYDEIVGLLGKEAGEPFSRAFGITKEGNYRDEATGNRNGRNILHIEYLPSGPDHRKLLSILKDERSRRKRPHKDDKVLADWNGLMISALAKAYILVGRKKYLDAARDAADFILSNMMDDQIGLHHCYRDGRSSVPGTLDDHAFLGNGFLDLYEATFQTKYLKGALKLADVIRSRFADRERGGFYLTSDGSEQLLFRPKEAYDGAYPSGNSAAFHLLLRAARMTGGSELEDLAVDLYKSFSGDIERAPSGYTWMLAGSLHLLGPSKEIVIAGEPADRKTMRMVEVLRDAYAPHKVVLLKGTGGEARKLEALAPFTADSVMIHGKPTAYVCEGWSCKVPTNDPEMLRDQLND
ncbi:MAG: thioredoxin domain-containing protein [Thermoplasmatota archaeon]